MIDKKTLRKEMRARKHRCSERELAEWSEVICGCLLTHPKVVEASVVLLYWALPDEVCTHGLVERLAAMGKIVLLPRVVSDTEMTLHRFTAVTDMRRGAYDILEPVGNEVSVEWLSTVLNERQEAVVGLIPGMAFDCRGHRLGRGKGYYDRMLAVLPGMYRIGICYPVQIVDEVPAEDTDIEMDEVVCGRK